MKKMSCEGTEGDKEKPGLALAMGIAVVPALVIEAIMVVPIALFLEKLELEGKFALPEWLVKPGVFALVSLFLVIWSWIGGLIYSRMSKGRTDSEP